MTVCLASCQPKSKSTPQNPCNPVNWKEYSYLPNKFLKLRIKLRIYPGYSLIQYSIWKLLLVLLADSTSRSVSVDSWSLLMTILPPQSREEKRDSILLHAADRLTLPVRLPERLFSPISSPSHIGTPWGGIWLAGSIFVGTAAIRCWKRGIAPSNQQRETESLSKALKALLLVSLRKFPFFNARVAELVD